jgi:transmembrane sensor
MSRLSTQALDAGASVDQTAMQFLLLEEGGKLDESGQARLSAWLDEDISHRLAYEHAHRTLAVVSANAADPEVQIMRRAALAARPDWTLSGRWVVAAVLVVGAVFGLRYWAPNSIVEPRGGNFATTVNPQILRKQDSARYVTAVGERLVIALPDGSTATLDTDSVMELAYTRTERGIRLLKGQALFDVAKHKPIPFQVYAASRRITAVGTEFNVRLDGNDVRVALLEGVVKVTTAAKPGEQADVRPRSIIMRAGEVADLPTVETIHIAAADTGKIVSWRSGVLVFLDKPLGEAVAEMNRYSTHPIVLEGMETARYRVSGVFKTGDPEHFAEMLTESFPLSLSFGADGTTVLRPRP